MSRIHDLETSLRKLIEANAFDSPAIGLTLVLEEAKRVLEEKSASPPAVDLEEIVSEWLCENTERTEWTFDDLAKIARLLVRFISKGVVG